MKTNIKTIVLFALFILTACDDWIEYSPYDADVPESNINAAEIAKLSGDLQSTSDTFKFAVMADIQSNLGDMSDAVAAINQLHDLRFVVCLGDITDLGLSQEFKWYADVLKKSRYPFITVIGNHDYRSNGYEVFCKLFGPPNISFVSGEYKFILFDNVIWENNNLSPKYEWLKNELDSSDRYNVVLTHIPPWGDQMEGFNGLVFKHIVNENNTILCLHGHLHYFEHNYYNGISTYVSAAINDREFYIISLTGDQSQIDRISF